MTQSQRVGEGGCLCHDYRVGGPPPRVNHRSQIPIPLLERSLESLDLETSFVFNNGATGTSRTLWRLEQIAVDIGLLLPRSVS